MRVNTFLAVAPSLMALVKGAAIETALEPVVDSDFLKGYTMFVPEWEVETHPGGPKVILNGTVEQVMDELAKINPNYVQDFRLMEDDDEVSAEHAAKQKRDWAHWKDAPTQCQKYWASSRKIYEGIKYLRKVPGRPSNGAGPGNCGRVSCSWNAAIFWCNDNKFTKVLDSFDDIADGAQRVMNMCDGVPPAIAYIASGQAFHKTDNWNVFLLVLLFSCFLVHRWHHPLLNDN